MVAYPHRPSWIIDHMSSSGDVVLSLDPEDYTRSHELRIGASGVENGNRVKEWIE